MNQAEKAVRDTIAELEALRSQLAKAKLRLRDEVRGIAEIQSRTERLRIVRDLYWNCDDARAGDLVIALLAEWDGEARAPTSVVGLERLATRYAARMRQMCGPIGYQKCAMHDCDRPAAITSRSHLKGYSAPWCDECQRKSNTHTIVTWEEQEAERREREARRARDRQRLSELEAASGLEPDELAELFELMARGF